MIKPSTIAARLAAASAVSVLAFVLMGCSASARPSAEELQTGITKIAAAAGTEDLLTEKYTECVADALVASDLSDATLAMIASGEELSSDEVVELNSDPATAAALAEAATACATTLQ